MSPGAEDQGQPTMFVQGRVSNAFIASFPSTESLSWVVGDARTTASIATARCEGTNIECTEEDIKAILSKLDNIARMQRDRVAGMARRSLPYTKRNPVDTAKARTLIAKAEKLYLAQWRDIWSSFPQIVKTCVGPGCTNIDKAADIAAIQARSRSFVRLARQASALLKRVSRNKRASLANEWLLVVLQLNEKSRLKCAELPRFESKCE
jgi:hypothetical protein